MSGEPTGAGEGLEKGDAMTTLTAQDTYTRQTLVFRGCRWITPYTAGYEDFRYQRIYQNPFKSDTQEFLQYDAGHTDARRSEGKR